MKVRTAASQSPSPDGLGPACQGPPAAGHGGQGGGAGGRAQEVHLQAGTVEARDLVVKVYTNKQICLDIGRLSDS